MKTTATLSILVLVVIATVIGRGFFPLGSQPGNMIFLLGLLLALIILIYILGENRE